MKIWHVDAFTDRPFLGNPAAVCILDGARPEEWMQALARELNLSETAYLLRHDRTWHLRWFTPTVEVELCGHATLASAHVLWETGSSDPRQEIVFETLSGPLRARRAGDWIELDFPATPSRPGAADRRRIADALGCEPIAVERSIYDLLVELDSETTLRELQPDLRRLANLDCRGVIATSRPANEGYDFVSRFFAPRAGIDEDPVTGSAHCCLAPYWAQRLGKTELTGYQASARGGFVRVRLAGDRVVLGGQAVTVLIAELV